MLFYVHKIPLFHPTFTCMNVNKKVSFSMHNKVLDAVTILEAKQAKAAAFRIKMTYVIIHQYTQSLGFVYPITKSMSVNTTFKSN